MFFSGLFSCLSGILVSAIESEDLSDKSAAALFEDDLLNEIQEPILDTFGTHFVSPEEVASDEENDGKLWVDIVQSIKQWQENKVRKLRRKLGLSR